MEEKLKKKLDELKKKAKENGVKSEPSHNRSSLHKIIRTQEQADKFMKLLKSA